MSEVYQPETLKELRELVATDPRASKEDHYAECAQPSRCIVARALIAAPQNAHIQTVDVVPTGKSAYRGVVAFRTFDNGVWREEPINPVLDRVASQFDASGAWFLKKSHAECVEFLDRLIAEEEAAK